MSVEGRAPTASVGSRRDLAVSRVLDPVRSRAEGRLQRFLDAALELLVAAPTGEVTVQEVVERSGQSLRSFYQYFDGKQGLMLAVFEDRLRATAQDLRELLADQTDPLARLKGFVVGYHLRCRPDGGADPDLPRLNPVLVQVGLQVTAQHPDSARAAFAPVTGLLGQLLRDGVASGVLRRGLDSAEVAAALVQAVTFNVLARVIAGETDEGSGVDEADELWELFLTGLQR